MAYSREHLIHFNKQHDTLVGVDSDGCVFHSMELKQKLCFHGEIIKHFELESIAPFVVQAAEFVNLYSQWRGANRFKALLKIFEELAEWTDVVETGVPLPELEAIRSFVESGVALSNDTLEDEVKRTGNDVLRRMLAWSEEINRNVREKIDLVPVFPGVRESLERMHAHSDVFVVSQTPTTTVMHEWGRHDLLQYVQMVAGPEIGAKAECLALAMKGRYARERVLMIGDAPGDLNAAMEAGACFYPINPGHEEASWRRFREEAYDRFLAGRFDAAYARDLADEFNALLPETPPWRQNKA
jgi:phosphoglycolate phosphatase-like HAD superfamily hydrolase